MVEATNNTAITSSKPRTLKDIIISRRDDFLKAMSNPKEIDMFLKTAIRAVMTNPDLQKATAASVISALETAAMVGVLPNTPLQEGYLIPFWNGKTKQYEAQFMRGYRGLIKLVWNSGAIEDLDFDTICENDDFRYSKGLEYEFQHTPAWNKDRGEVIGYYAFAHFKGGGFAAVVKSRYEIEKHAKRYARKNKDGKLTGVWVTDFDAMAIKTCIIELCDKKLPKRTTAEFMKLQQVVAAEQVKEYNYMDDKYDMKDLDFGQADRPVLDPEKEIKESNVAADEVPREAPPEAEKKVEEKPKRKRRTKAQIEAEKKAKEQEEIPVVPEPPKVEDKQSPEPPKKDEPEIPFERPARTVVPENDENPKPVSTDLIRKGYMLIYENSGLSEDDKEYYENALENAENDEVLYRKILDEIESKRNG